MAAYENWSFSSLPASVVERIKLFVLDTLGVIAAAADAPGIPEVNRLLLGWEGGGPSTMLIGKGRVAPPTAALANGAAAHALDFDDNHDPGRVHAYATILPAALAAAEARGSVSGRDFIAALATGVELQARLGLSAPNSMAKGWHPTTVMGALGAAAAAGRVLDLRAGKFSDAVALAYHQASGTRQALNDGVLAKRLGAGFASRNGTAAAFLAEAGLTGPTRFLEGEAGLFQLYERGEVLPDALLQDLGQTWEIMTHSMKPYPCCRCTHNAIAIGRELHREGLTTANIQSVVIGMSEVNNKIVGEPYDVARDSTIHAQFNAGYCFAAALIHGRVDVATFQRPQISDPNVSALAARTSVLVDDAIDAGAMAPTRVTILCKDGKRVERFLEFMEGSPEQPMTDDEAITKFTSCLEMGLGAAPAVINSLADMVLDLENCADIADIVAHFPALNS
ncbi:MmgE/PrpD family protein [Mycobacterium sp. ITM-2016-00318]|uniref:MmgE/PrpD family protein n=1 Tax=Mycobacterium sp. ITM-2016-00318 TaxID=2099693 RepID=UPI0013049D92|nr:MmgE/PrpD family protein [Mycobacterium sp. ITM-2016-00318]WNG94324.1 MmgE/PrpD family protein [Mycobacterium sp. ITM-2016-00318]